MNKAQYGSYILKKYKIEKIEFAKYIKIDAMGVLIDSIISENIVFKGALNLMFNHNYKRNDLTKDIDLSTMEEDFSEGTKKIEDIVRNLKHTIYDFKIEKEKEAVIAAGQYGGLTYAVSFVVRDTKIKNSFNVDVAVEELRGMKGLIKNDKIKYYSIERTLADKYVSMFQHGAANGREKDYVDIKELYEGCNKKLFYTLSKELIKARKIDQDKIDLYKSEFKEHKYIIEYKLEPFLSAILNKTT